MSQKLTVPGPLLEFRTEKALTPGMHAIVLRLGHEVDRARLRGAVDQSVWLTLPTAELRGARDDNHRLRSWLDGLMAVKLAGEYRGDPWGAVLVSEYRIEQGGAVVRVLVPPAAINALRAPETFVKVEVECAYRLRGAARTLYLALADKKRLDRDWWEFELPELRELLAGDAGRYPRFNSFRERVLDPAVRRINDFGTVHVTMTPVRAGRVVWRVRFDWRWKTLDEAREASEENDRHRSARGKPAEAPREAPPLTDEADRRPPSREEREAVLERTGAAGWAKGPHGQA